MKEKETAAEETVIKLEHICKSYYIGTQEVPVLTDIQLTINKGSFISIMGPSGAGSYTATAQDGPGDIEDRGQSIVVASLTESTPRAGIPLP